eukprot:GDKH01010088.1.p1 GENE.GDKH01010088.1~~GDKH01010088.1.p1  ORF type:complete len:95 (-),score=4.24 GDKH01010088.1:51-335(-)
MGRLDSSRPTPQSIRSFETPHPSVSPPEATPCFGSTSAAHRQFIASSDALSTSADPPISASVCCREGLDALLLYPPPDAAWALRGEALEASATS